jgi:hypothetical protein
MPSYRTESHPRLQSNRITRSKKGTITGIESFTEGVRAEKRSDSGPWPEFLDGDGGEGEDARL